jgi:phospholipase C
MIAAGRSSGEFSMNKRSLLITALAALISAGAASSSLGADNQDDQSWASPENEHEDLQKLGKIENVVVIYAENRSFDNLYGWFTGANGLRHFDPAKHRQTDRDGSELKELPPIWGPTFRKRRPPICPTRRSPSTARPLRASERR